MSIGALYPTTKPSLLLDFAKTKELDPRITFTRASTATFYDNDTSAKAEENLVLYSQQFDNANWEKNASSVTTNSTTAPDGTTTAETIIENSASGVHVAFQYSFISVVTVYTLSVFMKADTRNFGMVRVGGGNFPGNIGPAIKVDLTNGTVTTIAGTIISSSATSVGNGWYRCTMSFTSGSTTDHTPQFGPHDNGSSTTYTGNGTGSVFAWGAQLEQRSSVTAYTPTTTAAITNYIPVLLTAASGIPRFDHNPISRESLGLFIEEQRVNLALYSDQFDNASWTKANTSITSNTVVAPDGTLTGDKLIAASGSSVKYVDTSITTVASTTYSWSIYLKAGEYNSAVVYFIAPSTPFENCRVDINLTTGTLTNGAAASGATYVGATSTSVGNGWWRVTLTGSIGAKTTMIARVYPNVISAFTGDGFSGIYIWGAQLEVGAFATSYIPTVASQVTRSADTALMTGTNFSSWYSQDEGTLYAESSTIDTANFPTAASIYLDNNNFISLDTRAATVRALIFTNGTGILVRTSTKLSSNKIAICYRNGSSNVSFNGIAASTDITGNTPKNISVLYIGSFSGSATNYQNGTIKKIAYYPNRVTNTELQGLTS
jgi:hypothetical protein